MPRLSLFPYAFAFALLAVVAAQDGCFQTFQNSQCPLVVTCQFGSLFWSYPQGDCQVIFKPNITQPGKSMQMVVTHQNLVNQEYSIAVFDSETADHSQMLLFARGTEFANGTMRFVETDVSADLIINSGTALAWLTAAKKLDRYGLTVQYKFNQLRQ